MHVRQVHLLKKKYLWLVKFDDDRIISKYPRITDLKLALTQANCIY